METKAAWEGQGGTGREEAAEAIQYNQMTDKAGGEPKPA